MVRKQIIDTSFTYGNRSIESINTVVLEYSILNEGLKMYALGKIKLIEESSYIFNLFLLILLSRQYWIDLLLL
jgi:hypothetical protein